MLKPAAAAMANARSDSPANSHSGNDDSESMSNEQQQDTNNNNCNDDNNNNNNNNNINSKLDVRHATTADARQRQDVQHKRHLLHSNAHNQARIISPASNSSASRSPTVRSGGLSSEMLEFGATLKSDEVQVLFRNHDDVGRQLRDEHAKLVLPDRKQSPIALFSSCPAYTRLTQKPLSFDYPTRAENLRLCNTGIDWQVKIPYQLSMQTSLFGGVLPFNVRYKLDQFHCHWSTSDSRGSEHSVDEKFYSAELHFVHYNMEKYHTMSMAARHPDGLAVVAVFIDAQRHYAPHAEFEKVLTSLRAIQFKAEHSIIKQPIKLEKLLPANKSYWTYFGSLTTPPYYESVQWFVLKTPLKCNRAQTIDRFDALTSTLRVDEQQKKLASNCRRVQPLNGRIVASFDENN